MKPIHTKSWAGTLLMYSDLALDPLLQGQTTIAKRKSVDNLFIIGPRVL